MHVIRIDNENRRQKWTRSRQIIIENVFLKKFKNILTHLKIKKRYTLKRNEAGNKYINKKML